MIDIKLSSGPLPGEQPDRMFPQLTPEQMVRIASHGRARQVEAGEVLVEQVLIARSARRLLCNRKPYTMETDDDSQRRAT